MPAPEIVRIAGQADLFALHAARPDEYPYLLESRQSNPRIGRYSLLLTECQGTPRHLCRSPRELDTVLARLPAPRQGEASEVPFHGGWFLYLAYEAALGLQPHLQPPAAAESGPLALAVYCGGALIVDHVAGRTWIVSESGQGATHRQRLREATPQDPAPALALRFEPEPAADFRAAVRAAVDYIRAGDIYQANLSRRWQGQALADGDLLAAYARLREANRACFAASVQDPELKLASASPERLFLLDAGQIETRPIAGTRPRGDTPAADAALIRELLGHPKERAEHIMLVDLERNDLGRVCEAHSVVVDELLALESYATVHHIVSNIRGRLRPAVSLVELLRALFPGGTITGCPKIRCMQLISALERRWRGAYTGSLGYLSNHGRMDFNILIRSLVQAQGRVHFDAGAGIVADSDPDRELAETEAKAAGLMRALA